MFSGDIKYLVRSIKTVFAGSKSFFLWSSVLFLINAASPFISVYFSRYTVAYLSDPGYSVAWFLLAVFLFIFAIYFTGTLVSLLNTHISKIVLKLHDYFNHAVMDKCLNSTYENIVSKEFMEKKALAVKAYQSDRLTAVASDLLNIINSIVVVCGMSYIMRQLSYTVWIALLVVLLINVITGHYTKKATYQMDQFNSVYKVRTSYLRGTLNDFDCAKDIRVFDMKEGFRRKLDQYTAEAFRKMKEYYNSAFTRDTLVNVTDFVFTAFIYIYLGYRLLVQRDISLSEFVFVTGAVASVYNALQSMTGNFVSLNGNIVYIKDYFGFMDLTSGVEMDSRGGKTPVTGTVETLEVRQLSFQYPGSDTYAIKDLNYVFEKGSTYMIVGENGAGKSTLIKLILRFYDGYAGQILLNGIDIRQYPEAEYAGYLTVLFQDFGFLSLPISQNLAATDKDIDYARLTDLADRAGLSGKIGSLAHGIDNYMYRNFDPEGADFSGGELQKLALVRALYKEGTGVAIFDEPSSALDVYSEQEVLGCIRDAAEGRIVIYTTHRFSAKSVASRILVMSKGRLVEQGTHEELMESRGLYYTMFTLQASHYVREEAV